MTMHRAVALCAMVLCGTGVALSAPAKKAPARKAPAKQVPTKKAPPKPAPKKPAPNKGAGATQIRAIEGDILATTFNNGTFQVRFSNLRRALAWKDDGPGEGNHLILVDYDAGNVTKDNQSFGIIGRVADDQGRQTEMDAESEVQDILPASHAKGTIAFNVPDTFKPTKIIFKFAYDAGDPLRTFLPKDFVQKPLGNTGPAGTPVSNGLYVVTAAPETSPKLPRDWEPEEGNKAIVIAGTLENRMSGPYDYSFESVILNSKDGQAFEPEQWISGESGKLSAGGQRKFRVLYQVPEEVELLDIIISMGYMNDVPVRITF